jgi:nucleoside-diphosphate-sugar epimerase
VHVDDVVDALLLAATAPPARHGAIYHLVDDQAQFTQRELAARFGQPIVHLPRPLLYPLAWGVDQLCRVLKRPAPLSVYRVRSALAPLRYDCTLARTELGWSCALGTRQGLEQVLPAEIAARHE